MRRTAAFAAYYLSFNFWQHSLLASQKKRKNQRTKTTGCKTRIKQVNNLDMISAPEGTIPFCMRCCEQAMWRHDVTNEPCKIQLWIMKHNTAFCNRKNKRWDHQQAREERVKESKRWLNDQKLAEESLCHCKAHSSTHKWKLGFKHSVIIAGDVSLTLMQPAEIL